MLDNPGAGAAARPVLTVAAGAATERLQLLQHHVVCTAPVPWSLVSAAAAPPEHLILAEAVDRADLEALAADVPAGLTAAVGVGGDASLETAKFIAWRCGLELLQIPTSVSSDAAFRTGCRYREGGRMQVGGPVTPVEVVVDPLVIRQAPASLNRAGVGDVLACHTALYDWRLAVRVGAGERWDAELAATGLRMLDQLELALPDIAAVSIEGVAHLARAHSELADLRDRGGGRVVEGSEHALASTIEWLAGRRFVHGRLLALCTLAIALVQGNDPDRPARMIGSGLVEAAPAALGVDPELFRRAFLELPGYCRQARLGTSVVDLVALTPELAADVYGGVVEVTG